MDSKSSSLKITSEVTKIIINNNPPRTIKRIQGKKVRIFVKCKKP